jgi:hypothetical protein
MGLARDQAPDGDAFEPPLENVKATAADVTVCRPSRAKRRQNQLGPRELCQRLGRANSGDAVENYRLFFFDGERLRRERVTRPIRLRAPHEDAAVARAHQLRGGRYAELWRNEDLVKIFDIDSAR